MNWPLCLPLRIQIIKANAVLLCAVTMGTVTVAASSLLFALAGNQSWSGGGDGRGRVGGDVAWRGMVEVIQRLEAHRGFVQQTGSRSTLVLSRGRDQVFLTTSALSSTQHAPPDPDKICMCHNHNMHPPSTNLTVPPSLDLFTLAHLAETFKNIYDFIKVTISTAF